MHPSSWYQPPPYGPPPGYGAPPQGYYAPPGYYGGDSPYVRAGITLSSDQLPTVREEVPWTQIICAAAVSAVVFILVGRVMK